MNRFTYMQLHGQWPGRRNFMAYVSTLPNRENFLITHSEANTDYILALGNIGCLHHWHQAISVSRINDSNSEMLGGDSRGASHAEAVAWYESTPSASSALRGRMEEIEVESRIIAKE